MPERLLSAAACAEIAARAAKATAGPWWYECTDEGDDEVGSDPQGFVMSRPESAAASFTTDEDGQFIAAAREDIPALLADREELLARIAALREALEPLVKPAGVISGGNSLSLLIGICGDEPDFTLGDLRRAAAVYEETK